MAPLPTLPPRLHPPRTARWPFTPTLGSPLWPPVHHRWARPPLRIPACPHRAAGSLTWLLPVPRPRYVKSNVASAPSSNAWLPSWPTRRSLDYAPAQTVLEAELARQNRTLCRTTGCSPDEACAKAQQEQRSRAPSLSPLQSLFDPPFGSCTWAAASMRTSPDRLLGPQLANRPHRPTQRHPHPSSAGPVLGRASSPSTTPKPLARHPRKVLPLTLSFCSRKNSPFSRPPSAGKFFQLSFW